MTGLTVELGGEEVQLLPERALYWPRGESLVVADLHWGKGATFRAAGIPVPRGTTGDDLARLDRVLGRTSARRLVVLGDLFHARAGRVARGTLEELKRWRASHADVEILLVRGNHDRHAGDPPDDLAITCVTPPVLEPPFVLQHHPVESSTGYTLAGHLHPCLTLSGPALLRERLPCFVTGPRLAVLPAFGSFTGHCAVEAAANERIYVVAGDDVLSVGAGFDHRD